VKTKITIIFLYLCIILLHTPAAEQTEQDPPLFPDFYYPFDTPFFHLWANPAHLAYNESLKFHSSLHNGIYSSLSALVRVLNGNYPLIAYWVDQFAAGGYGAALCTDNGIEGKYWSAGINMTLNAFTKGPVFPQVSYGSCTLTTALYAGVAYPFTLDDVHMSIGATVMPLHRLKIPMTTEFYTALILNIIDWDQSKLRELFKDMWIYQGLGFGINSTFMLQYKDVTALLLVENIFDSHIWYKKFELGRFLEDPGILFTENDKPVDHVGIIPLDVSLSGEYTITMPYRLVRNITLGCGIYHPGEALTTETTTIVDTLSLTGTIQFGSHLFMETALHRGSFYCNFSLLFTSWEITTSFFTAMNKRDDYPGPSDALAIGIHYFH
jgi:hypothetical protein